MRKISFLTFALVFSFVFLIGCGGDDNGYNPPPITNSNQFVFLRGQPTPTPTGTPADSYDLMQVMVGSITSNGGIDIDPVGEPTDIMALQFSSDGQKVALMMYPPEGGPLDVFVTNADLTGLINLSNSPEWDQYPAFSSDKAQVLWIGGQEFDIIVAPADGSGTPVNITSEIDIPFHDASFSPDGATIVAADLFGEDIWMMNADGTGLVNLTYNVPKDNVLGYIFPIYTADGSKILYTQVDLIPDDPETEEDESYAAYDIYSMNPDATEPEQLTGGELDYSPHLAGDRVMYQSEAPGNSEVYTIRPDGTGAARMTGNTVFDGFTTEGIGMSGKVSGAQASASSSKWPRTVKFDLPSGRTK